MTRKNRGTSELGGDRSGDRRTGLRTIRPPDHLRRTYPNAHEALQSAAADAARSASIARDAQTATTDARAAATASVSNQYIRCTQVEVTVDTSDFNKAPGVPGSVAVTVSCRLHLSDLALPAVPGSKVFSSTMSSPIDTWREP